ncbi:MAG: amidohydrolase family protein [Anaerolineae bacterium]|nr:amidohydrolase family protein [Anaerolineae bacterium]
MNTIDTLFVNAIVLTMDAKFHIYEPGAVAVGGSKIIAVGDDHKMREKYAESAGTVFDCQGKVLMPGLVNVHTHVPMTLLRGLADDLRLDVWLMGYMMPVEREFVSPEFVKLGTQLACAEMIRSGVTSFADMYYFESDIAEATAAAGMRAVLGESVLKFPSPDARSYEEGLANAEAMIRQWKGHELIVPAVAPHAPYTCTDEILNECAQLAAKYDVPLHTHLSETAQEVENMRKDKGMPVIPYVKKQDLFMAKVIAAHCVHIDDGEIHTLKHHKAGVAHNPSSNMKLSSGAAPVHRMLEIGVDVGIGTDGTGSNNDLDMFDEIRLASFLSKLTTMDPTSLPARTALLMGTRMGAKVIGLDKITGSIETGKAADMILVELDTLHNMPRFAHNQDNIYAQLIYAAKSSDVTDVMINGAFVMRDHQLLTLDETRIKAEAQQVARQIDDFLQKRENSVLSKLIAVGGAMEEESFEVQAKVAISDPTPVLEALEKPAVEIVYKRHYHEYDTYFAFEDRTQGYLRYREDHFIDDDGQVSQVRSRLTLIGPEGEEELPEKVLLSRSRFLAPATQSFRFYREYFKPAFETEVEKDRRRFLIRYHGTEFYVNIDQLIVPALGYFLEVKSRTWSRRDAEAKSMMIAELLSYLNTIPEEASKGEYVKMAVDHHDRQKK